MTAKLPPAEPATPYRYDPWRDLRENWPEVQVVVEAMAGRLLGRLCYPVIALREGTSAAQRRCTLAHEIVHLERGVTDCGPWAAREERLVHASAAGRLIDVNELASVVRAVGGTHDLSAVAHALDVDRETLRIRLALLTAAERSIVSARMSELWSVA